MTKTHFTSNVNCSNATTWFERLSLKKPSTNKPQDKFNLWLYGANGSGKTHFASSFPNSLLISIETLSPKVECHEVSLSNFDEAIELSKCVNDLPYNWIIIDTLDRFYGLIRRCTLDSLDLNHEQEMKYVGWKIVDEKFWDIFSPILNSKKGIILLSQEEIFEHGPSLFYQPETSQKLRHKISSQCHVVGRIFKTLEGYGHYEKPVRYLSCGFTNFEFSNFKVPLKNSIVKADFNEFMTEMIGCDDK